MVAVLSLVDLKMLRDTWTYSRADFTAAIATIAATLLAGVEQGLVAGIAVSLGLHLYREGASDGPPAQTAFLRHLTGKVFLSQYEAVAALAPELTAEATA